MSYFLSPKVLFGRDMLRRGSTLEDAAASVHKDFQAKLKYTRIWAQESTMG